ETLLRKPETPQTDMYSLGVTLFEVLTGDLPFKGTTPAELLVKHATEAPPVPSSFNPNVSPEMDRFILRLLAKNPKKRHKSMDEVHAEFRALQPFNEDVQEVAQKLEAEAHQKEMARAHSDRLRFSPTLSERENSIRVTPRGSRLPRDWDRGHSCSRSTQWAS
ncbi:MAG: protein kinase, partial [Proteobacteria bacterium]|nr:protein kinase [Pseudomonadota bacterium]